MEDAMLMTNPGAETDRAAALVLPDVRPQTALDATQRLQAGFVQVIMIDMG